jgi:hypothetical protein
MAKKALEDAVRARLAAYFSTVAILDVNDDVLPPAAGSGWVRVEFPVANSAPTSLNHTNSEVGSFRIVVAAEVLSGAATSLTNCEEVAAIFSRQRFDGVTCFVPSIGDGRDDGSFYKRSVIVPYRYEYAV